MSITRPTGPDPGVSHRQYAAPPVDAVAAAFPQLEILALIGQGGMGCVFKARQPQLNRFVALKILPEALARDPAFASRFTREAQALALLSHPNIVTIHDFGQANGFFYLLMEFVDGVNLRQALRAGRFTPEQALAIVPPICEALQFAHERGIVHRDIKPENLLLDKSGHVKIADFGIAKMLGGKPAAAGPAEAAALQHSAAGTPQYMAPEQCTDPQNADHRADIYSLGVVLYEMLTGELPAKPFEPPSRKVQIDVRLDEVVLRALEKEPSLRWQTATDFRTQVETITGSVPGRAGRLDRAASETSGRRSALHGYLALGLLLAGILGTLLLMTISPRHDLALIFGGTALVMALAFGLMNWRERIGKGVVFAVLAIASGAGITVAVLTEAIPSPFQALNRAEIAAQGAREAASVQAAAEHKDEKSGAVSTPGSKRERFEPRAGMANRTSWGVFDKPSAFNPDGWAVMARMTLGGEAPVRLPGRDAEECRITLIEGSDEKITVAIREPARPNTVTLTLRRDQPAEFTIDGRGYRILYPSVTVALNQPGTSPFAQVVVTPVVREPPREFTNASSGAGVEASAPNAPVDSARDVVDRWLAHVKADRMPQMWDLTTRESGGAGSVVDLRNTWQFDKIKAYTLAMTSNAAMVVTTRFKDNAGRERKIAFALVQRDGRWLIRDHWTTTPENAESRLAGFVTGSNARFDVRRSDIVGRWYVASIAPARFEFHGDGTFSTSYRVVGGRTNFTGAWMLQEDELTYQTAGGGVTGRVVNVREDFFQLRIGEENFSGFHRAEDRPTTGQATPHFEPVKEVTLTTNQFLTFKDGQVLRTKPSAHGGASLVREAEQLFIEFDKMHAIALPKDTGIEQWNAKSAAELIEDYQDAGFALLSSERFSKVPVKAAELPLTFLLPGAGFLQVMELSANPTPSVKLRYKLVQP